MLHSHLSQFYMMKRKNITKFIRKTEKQTLIETFMCVWFFFFLKIDRLVVFEGTLRCQQSQLQNIVFVFKNSLIIHTSQQQLC